MKKQMKAKKLMISLVAIFATVLILASAVSATELVDNYDVYIRDNLVDGSVSVEVGETIPVRVSFQAGTDAREVKIKAEIEGYRVDIEDTTSRFDIEEGNRYSKTLSLRIPFNLEDELSEDATLEIKVFSRDDKFDLDDIELRVQRESFNVAVMSVETLQTANAGSLLPVDVVLKNRGYNDLDDLFVTAKISELGVEQRSYFSDIVAFECDEDDEEDNDFPVNVDDCDEDDVDTVTGRIFLQVPEGAASGVYTLDITARNLDTETVVTKQIVVENDFSGDNVIVGTTAKSVSVGQTAEYEVLIVNPTSKLKVYRVVPESSSDLFVSVSDSVVAIPAGSSKTVSVMAKSNAEGTYNFNVSVFADETLVNSATLSTNVEGRNAGSASPVVVLTVILAIIFIVLIIVLLVLLGKKPEKSEEFGESYY